MNRIEQAQQDVDAIWCQMPHSFQEKALKHKERLDHFLSELQLTAKAEGDWYWLEEEPE